jgi:hypothetical protein
VDLVIFSLLLIGQQGLDHFISHWPMLPIGWRILQAVRQRQGKLTNETPFPLGERHLQQAKQLLSLVNYTSFVISYGLQK